MIESFVFYRSFYEAAKKLKAEEFKEALMGIFEYVFEEEEPIIESTTADIIFTMARPQIDANIKRKVNGSLGGRPKTIGYEDENHRLSDTKPNVNVNDNVNDNVNVNVKKESVRKNFTPPTTEDVAAYVAEKGYKVDAERFVDFYESKGWMVGKNKMKDWKACVRTWSKTDEKEQRLGVRQSPQSKIHDYNERSYDYNQLMNEIKRG